MTRHLPITDKGESYQNLVTAIRQSINRPLTDAEAEEATRNLIGFCRTLLAIHMRLNQNQRHDENR